MAKRNKYRTYKTQKGAERYLKKLAEQWPERRAMFYIGIEPHGFRFVVYYSLPDGKYAACM